MAKAAVVTKIEANAKLKRMDLVLPKAGNDNAILADKAAKLLGYTGAMVTRNVAGELGKVLIDLDIRPYDTKRTAAYKEKKRKEAHAERRARTASYYDVRSRWVQVQLDKFTGVVPDFALRKAIMIKEAMPEAQFFVDVLKVNTKRIPDPFLVVKLGTEKYWVEVWDETEFEASLIDE